MLRQIRQKIKRWRKRRTEYADPRAYWERRGRTYRGEHKDLESDGALGDLSLRFIADQVLKLKPESVLEVGCGYGALIRRLAEQSGIPVYGIDFSSAQFHEAKSYLGSLRKFLVRADAVLLPFGDGVVDVLVTSGVLMHIYPQSLPAVIGELARVTKRWLVHNEDLVRSFHAFGHDLERVYGGLGYEVAETFPNPYGLAKQKLQVVIVSLEGTCASKTAATRGFPRGADGRAPEGP